MSWWDEFKRAYGIDEDKVLMAANYYKVLERDCFTCQNCGKKDDPKKYSEWGKSENAILEIHHIIPRKDGGKSEIDNLITLCKGWPRKNTSMASRQETITSGIQCHQFFI
ncbi:hypothetical protein DRP04_01050 [Archaeoglobales archaeon]|nr:MAG: hypothetical protein DRP04_01050 [Archaeoglobales archaeon]